MKLIMLSLSLFLVLSPLYAQNMTPEQKEIQKQIEEIMKNREEMLRSLFNDDSFKDMENRMQEMMKRFAGEDFNFNSDSFFGGAVVGQYDWVEDDKYKVLKIKVTQIKDRPLDIKIEKGQIKIKGDVETAENQKSKNKIKQKVHFERIFSIPSGVDEKNPEFENKDGELLIKFKKTNSSGKAQKRPNTIEKEASENNDERKPISPDEKDISF